LASWQAAAATEVALVANSEIMGTVTSDDDPPIISDGDDSCVALDSEPPLLPNMGLYAEAQSYVQQADEAFQQKYFRDRGQERSTTTRETLDKK
jgi:hypothetical protein